MLGVLRGLWELNEPPKGTGWLGLQIAVKHTYQDMMKFMVGCGWGRHNWELVALWDELDPEWKCVNPGCPRNVPCKNIPEFMIRATGDVDEKSLEDKPMRALVHAITDCLASGGVPVEEPASPSIVWPEDIT